MAGNYPDVPSWRMAYDRDGTQGVSLDTTKTSVLGQYTQTQMTQMNDESNATQMHDDTALWVAMIFPELRDLDAITMISEYGNNPTAPVEVSADTTNGVNGTWTSIGSVSKTTTKVGMRSSISSTTALGIRAVRFKPVDEPGHFDASFFGVHLYGEIVPGENPHRLQIIKSGVDQHVDPAEFDWGNALRNTTATKTLRVKNLSPSLTAQSVRVAMEAITDATPSVPGQHELSLDGTTWLAQVNVGNLAPGAISAPISFRRTTPTNAELSLWWIRLFSEATSWV